MSRFGLSSALFGALALVAVVAAPAWAMDEVSTATVGGTQLDNALHASPQSASHLELMEGGGFSAGVVSNSGAASLATAGMTGQVGGYLSYAHDFYRVDAALRSTPSGGGVAADLTASVGAAPGVPGTSYALVLGASMPGPGLASSFPGPRIGLTSSGITPGSDVKFGFTVNHVLTSGLSLIGTASATHELGGSSMLDAGYTANELTVGAGLGLRF